MQKLAPRRILRLTGALSFKFTFLLINDLARGLIVQKLIEYMCFKAHYQHSKKEEVPIHEFIERIPPEIVLELCVSSLAFRVPTNVYLSRLLAADYLDSELSVSWSYQC